MFRDMPEQRLWLVKERRAELVHDADQYRLARADPHESADHQSPRLFNRIRARFAWPLAALPRALSGYKAPCDDSCPDCAPC